MDRSTVEQTFRTLRAKAVIKRIELVNFMSHEHSVFVLTEGLNVLVGPNNCGKSAVVTALQILCYNDQSKYALRHESKECSIQVETDDGHVVRWARKKSGSPFYEIDGQRFDRLGKNGVPDLLHQVLRLDRVVSDKDRFDVHFGEQRSPVFLINDKPRQAADFFASSSDAKHLLEMQALHKQNVRDANNEHKRLQREAVELESSLKRLAPLDQLVVEMEAAEAQSRHLDELEQDCLHLENVCKGMEQAKKEIEVRAKKLEFLAALPSPPAFQDETALAKLIESLSNVNRQHRQIQHREDALKTMTEPPVLTDLDQLQQVIVDLQDRLHDLNYVSDKAALLESLPEPPEQIDTSVMEDLSKKLARQLSASKKLQQKSEALDEKMQQVRNKIQEWTETNPACPTCGGEVTMEQLLSSGGHRHER